MKGFAEPVIIGRIVFVLLTGVITLYLIFQMVNFGGENSTRSVASVEEIVEKALVQCYALEGSYPMDIEYVRKYGVILDYDRFIYHYEWYGGNLRPNVIILER